jgi:hypothetical protein
MLAARKAIVLCCVVATLFATLIPAGAGLHPAILPALEFVVSVFVGLAFFKTNGDQRPPSVQLASILHSRPPPSL